MLETKIIEHSIPIGNGLAQKMFEVTYNAADTIHTNCFIKAFIKINHAAKIRRIFHPTKYSIIKL